MKPTVNWGVSYHPARDFGMYFNSLKEFGSLRRGSSKCKKCRLMNEGRNLPDRRAVVGRGCLTVARGVSYVWRR